MVKFLIKLIKFYQKFISPSLGRNCRYFPSCSEYAKRALNKHGLLKGIIFSFYRLLRCHPLAKGGLDNP